MSSFGNTSLICITDWDYITQIRFDSSAKLTFTRKKGEEREKLTNRLQFFALVSQSMLCSIHQTEINAFLFGFAEPGDFFNRQHEKKD